MNIAKRYFSVAAYFAVYTELLEDFQTQQDAAIRWNLWNVESATAFVYKSLNLNLLVNMTCRYIKVCFIFEIDRFTVFKLIVDVWQSNDNGNALLYSCDGNVMHYFKNIK